MYINISKDFTTTPGGRYADGGEFSAEDFRDKLLKPSFLEAIEKGEILEVDLDGGYGYAACFLEEAFGGLIRDLDESSYREVLSLIKVKSEEEPTLIADITEYISDAIELRIASSPSTNTARQKFVNQLSHNGEYRNFPPIKETPVAKSTEKDIEEKI